MALVTEYPAYVKLRIERARQKAMLTDREAWWVGQSPNKHCGVFMVHSDKGEHMYYLDVYDHPGAGGYNYNISEDDHRDYWCTCTCDAFGNGNPCWHGARVQLAIEHRLNEREGVSNDYQE